MMISDFWCGGVSTSVVRVEKIERAYVRSQYYYWVERASICYDHTFCRTQLDKIVPSAENVTTSMSTLKEIRQYKWVIPEKYSCLASVYGETEVLTISFVELGDSIVQNILYNAWKSDHFCAVLLLFTFVKMSLLLGTSMTLIYHSTLKHKVK